MTDKTVVMVTGGAGFIGSAVCRHLIAQGTFRVVNVDKLTYSGCLASLAPIDTSPDYVFYQADICDGEAIRRIGLDGVCFLARGQSLHGSSCGHAIRDAVQSDHAIAVGGERIPNGRPVPKPRPVTIHRVP